MWHEGHFKTINIAGSIETRAEGINNAGVISGEFVDSDGNEHGFLLRDQKFRKVDVPDSFTTDIWMVADDGAFVGDYSDVLTVHGFLSPKPKVFVTLDFPTAAATAARWINERGEVVGRWDDNSVTFQIPCTTQCHGFLWAKGQFRSIDVPGAISTVALGINNRGRMVGRYIDSAGNEHGFTAVPKDER